MRIVCFFAGLILGISVTIGLVSQILLPRFTSGKIDATRSDSNELVVEHHGKLMGYKVVIADAPAATKYRRQLVRVIEEVDEFLKEKAAQ